MKRRAVLGLGLSALSWLMLALSAGLVASGVSALIEYRLLVAPVVPFARVRAAAAHLDQGDGANAILHRNPFDSTTGPLDVVAEAPVEPAVPVNVDPLAAPDCEQLDVYSTMESSDPSWSSAVIQGEKELHGRVRRPGDRVDGRRVVFIGFNPRVRSPAVWLESDAGLCQSILFDGKPRRNTAPPKKAPAPKPPRRPGKVSPLPPSIAGKIARRSATEFDVDRAAVDAIMQEYSKLMRGTRVRPVQKDGKLVGLGLRGIRPDSLLGKLGLKDGDQVRSINGFTLTSPEKALQAYARLRTVDKLVVSIVRGNKPLSLDYRIR